MGLIVTTPTHVQVLEDYWKDWKLNKGTNEGPVKFGFSDSKKVQGTLSSDFGDGWEATLMGARMVRGLDLCERIVV